MLFGRGSKRNSFRTSHTADAALEISCRIAESDAAMAASRFARAAHNTEGIYEGKGTISGSEFDSRERVITNCTVQTPRRTSLSVLSQLPETHIGI